MENQELKVKVKNEEFDVKVQRCDPYHCHYDCLVAPEYCNSKRSPDT